MKVREGDLEIDFTDEIEALIFDQMKGKTLPDYHGVAEMYRVDFVVEFETRIVFVEIKDPGNPKAQVKGLEKFWEELKNGSLSRTFANKFVDSFLYRWAEEKIHKPVDYLNIITLDDAALLINFSDEIRKVIPPMGKTVPRWRRQLVENCQVFNLETWNETFPGWPVTRLNQSTERREN